MNYDLRNVQMDDKITLHKSCRFCRKSFSIKVYEKDLKDWKEGQLIQNVFPYLTVSERELLISDLCEDCYFDLFALE